MKKYSRYRKDNGSFWRSPQLLFLILGIIICFTSIILYLIAIKNIEEPTLAALIVIIVNIFLLIVSFVILKNFEKTIEISKIKSEFINIVSHQLRSPIVNLKWALEILEEEDDIEKQKKYIKNLRENIERITELVEDFFIASRIQEEKINLKREDVDLKKTTEDAISRFKIFAENLDVKISLQVDENIPFVFIDPSQIKLVIENLLDNAICYNKKNGQVNISITKKNSKVYFKIEDSGFGIPKEDQKNIFEKFFRSKNSQKRKEKGTGLGLFITKSIIENEKGKIWFKSEEEKGTTFYFYLPIKK
ncbi:MAG: HAMP domain-containing sensor histidine kinase [Candidatus Paceibacterota bacterium]